MKTKSGFTLVELMVTASIIMVIAVILVPYYDSLSVILKETKAESILKDIKKSTYDNYILTDQLPITIEGIAVIKDYQLIDNEIDIEGIKVKIQTYTGTIDGITITNGIKVEAVIKQGEIYATEYYYISNGIFKTFRNV